MTPSFPGHTPPAVGFEVPLEMLAACHGRVQHQCETLQRLLAHLPRNGPDRAAQEAALAVIRYFDTAAPLHHQDEELDLFPALLDSMAGSDAVCLKDLIASLCCDHRTLERRWRDVREALLRIASGQDTTPIDAVVSGFIDAYAQHIEREEGVLLPLAARLLSDAELDRIGVLMRARRADSTG